MLGLGIYGSIGRQDSASTCFLFDVGKLSPAAVSWPPVLIRQSGITRRGTGPGGAGCWPIWPCYDGDSGPSESPVQVWQGLRFKCN